MRRLRLTALAVLAISVLLLGSAVVLADDPESLTLLVSSARETCTLGSVTTLDYTIEGGAPPYQLRVDGREVTPGSDAGLIRCRDSTVGSPFESSSAAGTRFIAVKATDSVGAHVYKVVEVRLAPPPPAPAHVVATGRDLGSSRTFVAARWWMPSRRNDDRSDDFMFRWRTSASDEWNYEQRPSYQNIAGFNEGSLTIDVAITWQPIELQVAQTAHPLDLQAPEALDWSLSAHIPILQLPRKLQAEATHDTISVSWGPHPSGLSYRADLSVVGGPGYGGYDRRVVADESPYRARFVDLLPDTPYRVGVCLVEMGRQSCWPRAQHVFELRTEPAPQGWTEPSRLATEVNAAFVNGEIEVTWTAPETGWRHETRVCARESDLVIDIWSWPGQCETVGPGETRALLSPLNWYWPGGSYQVQVSTLTAPPGTAITEVHLPTYDLEAPTRGEPPVAPRFSGVGWINHGDWQFPRYLAHWTFDWPMDGAELAELSWRERNRSFLRETRQTKLEDRGTGEFRIGTESGVRPKSIRIRLLKDGAWTPWSEPTSAPDMGGPILDFSLSEGPDGIEAQWSPPAFGTEIDGYRLYVSRDGGSDAVIEVGTATRSQIPILPQDERYFVRVVSLSEEHGEGGSGYARHTRRAQAGSMAISLWQSGSWCPPSTGGRIDIRWSIQGGTPPFTVAIADRLGFETRQRSGPATVACPERIAHTRPVLRASVVDADGGTADDTLKLGDFRGGSKEVDEDPFAVHVDLRSVHRDRVLLRWDCRYLPYAAALRWRQSGDDTWTFESGFTQSRGGQGDYRCRGTWSGLQPLTSYEYQLAHYWREEQLRRPDLLRWTDVHAVTTLGEPVNLHVERDGETVAVSWERQHDAWAYVVRMYASGRSWWKRYEPGGEARETVYFYRIPPNLDLGVELISPPLEDGEEARTPWFDEEVVTGH